VRILTRDVRDRFGPNRAGVLAHPTGVERADAINIRIPIEGDDIGLMAEGA
jgi:hypothetical protein